VSDEAVGAGAVFTPGALIGGYRIDSRLGQGGMAVVYRAHDDRLGRLVALKVLAEEFAEDPEFRQRFMRESRAAAAVDDPHIIPVFNAGESGDLLYIAMRYVRGGDVAELLRQEGELPPVRAAEIVAQVASALDAAHRHGLVHRDVKPSNMLLDTAAGEGRPDHVYLADFGLSKHALTSTRITASGQFLGTLDYVAPEQIEGLQVDGRTDQYALACAAFELLAGEPPFHRDHTVAIIHAQLNQPPPPLSARRSALPTALDPILQRAMAKSPVERYRSCGAFAAALAAAVGAHHAGVVLGPATPASPTRPVDTPVPAQVPRQASPAVPATVPQPAAAPQPVMTQPAGAQQQVRSQQPRLQRAGAGSAIPVPVAKLPNAGVYVPPPGVPGLRSSAERRASGEGGGRLPARYRFGWLSVPILAVVTALALAAPIESL
jgi:serine/threonine protein kinase